MQHGAASGEIYISWSILNIKCYIFSNFRTGWMLNVSPTELSPIGTRTRLLMRRGKQRKTRNQHKNCNFSSKLLRNGFYINQAVILSYLELNCKLLILQIIDHEWGREEDKVGS